MAQQPQFRPQLDPSGQGPLLVVPTDPGAAGRARAAAGGALAGLGESAFRTGVFLTAEAQEAERRTQELQRATAVSDGQLARTQTFLAVRDEILRTPDPEAAQARWAQARGELAPVNEAAGDERTAALQRQAYDQQMSLWESVIAGDIRGLRVRQADQSLDAARTASVQMRDTSLFLERLQAAAPIVGWNEQQVQDEFAAVDRAVSAELTKDRIATQVLTMPYDEAVAWLNSEAPFYGTGLDPQAKQQFLDQQMGLLTRQQARAAQEARIAAGVQQRNAAEVLARAGRGEPVDVDRMWDQVEAGTLDPGVARTVQETLIQGPATADDPATLQQLLVLQDRVARGAAPAAELTSFALAHAGTRLKDSTWTGALEFASKSFTPQMQAVNEEVQQAARELVTVTEQGLQQMMTMLADPTAIDAAENQRAFQQRQVDYVRRTLLDYVRQNPAATADDIYRERLITLRGLQRQSADQVRSLLEAYESRAVTPPAAAPPTPAAPPAAGFTSAVQQAAADWLAPWNETAPAGLETVWPGLDERQRAQVVRLLGKGATPAQILEALRQ